MKDKSLTNSPIGSSHWYRTLMGCMKSIGLYMQKYEITEDQRLAWGKQVEEYSAQLIKHHDKINIPIDPEVELNEVREFKKKRIINYLKHKQ